MTEVQGPIEHHHPVAVQQCPKQFVLDTVRNIIYSGELINPNTNQPLSRYEMAEYMTRATFYFIREQRNFCIQMPECVNALAPAYDVIITLFKMEDWLSETLKMTVQMICQTPARDEDEYQKFMGELRRSIFPQGSDRLPDDAHEHNLSEMTLVKKVWGHVQDNMWGYISAATSSTFGKAVLSSALDEIALACQGTIQPYNIAIGIRSTVMVSGLYLCGTICYNVYEASRGRRSWKRVGKNVSEEVAAVSAGALAGIGIAAILAPFTGGISLICGALVSIAANLGTRALAKKYTGKIFNLPEDEWLERAYETLDVNHLAANEEISKAYRKKSRDFHPDKIYPQYPNATEEEKNIYLRRFLKVQAAFGMIMAARNKDIDDYGNAKKHFERIREDELLKNRHIDIAVKLWAASQWRKLWSFFVKTRSNLKWPAITNGIMPYECFSLSEDAVAA